MISHTRSRFRSLTSVGPGCGHFRANDISCRRAEIEFRYMSAGPKRPITMWIVMVIFSLAFPSFGDAYSVLSHEAIIDAAWSTHIVPLLRQRFPAATPDELRQAHAYAYGGAIIQDMGYYPYGSKFFSDLTHYVRAGDFIETMLRDARDLNEYAFAVGAMSHYAADNEGHHLAVNRVVPLLYPGLGRKYGNEVTFE